MIDRRTTLGMLVALPALSALSSVGVPAAAPAGRFTVSFTPAEWKRRLGGEAYGVLREEGTERPFTSPLNNEKRTGLFVCRGCALPLFSSLHKFDSGTGWPSFWQPVSKTAIGSTVDRSFMMTRTEVHCSRCGGHQGHVFDDGPRPTGLRYCINGLSLAFVPGKTA